MCITANVRKPLATLATLAISVAREIADLAEDVELAYAMGVVDPAVRERLRRLRQYQELVRAMRQEVMQLRDLP